MTDPVTKELFYEKTLVERYASPAVTPEQQASLQVFHQQRYRTRLGRSSFLDAITDWVSANYSNA